MASLSTDTSATNAWDALNTTSVSNSMLSYVEEAFTKNAPDLSPSLFQSLGEDLSVGRFKVDWHYMPEGWSPQ